MLGGAMQLRLSVFNQTVGTVALQSLCHLIASQCFTLKSINSRHILKVEQILFLSVHGI